MTGLDRERIVDGAPALSAEELQAALAGLPGWQLAGDGKSICREWRFKNFKQAAQLANLAAWQAEAAGHHPDIAFGWGHARVSYSTHSAGGVSRNDLIMAARLDAATG
ncbi:4a-hydroxytetrahydrobiopterin dehydratase [Paracoccus denitrificans]|jgi:4a-hydroxytetrahydrobiopterin dehydratase|uniref:Putative pterin-4-alpha-carbinolamine dehydratase n=1 Tax=Paracoccus denitrificans (strain Pd 1222) TaxID=318586 RepID=PHS_PARDP|nr:4a-hydroxytetrahydrobiopterin dehydratase [Paracoccus denitrificans]A1B3I3.1 RecName: Full=Putative pterin-4-alpha-carbinolamine dehydratase; Short=PHS; AltName: Full=4-alpha-hydroxy-tetrahydropterin dehydratase; AltName: Full=Pterin carbinolamine dehydratase; Short=PCD [Paracoccus denitrificans PD1222]ABL70077.1 pterin-4-alpha-carbinolamine dehydratase [Paracoccus denitrificans PD1222]MBB4628794.1 4a-hydroxytetrahydrobiopterin dehydratase [Paracoccus denitrificans]MCU7429823.1 4a-hydroxytet